MANAVVGRVLLIPKGDYASGTTYNMLDLVRYNNKSWVCKQTCTGQTPQEDSYWQLMASDGAEGGYCYIRYSANSDGTGFVVTPTENTIYIGFYTGDSETAPTDKTAYTWSKFVGADGRDGVSASASVSKVGKVATITCQTGSEEPTTATISDGEDGEDGASINLAGEWYVGTEYVNNGSRIDIVSKSGNSYGCLQSHIASSTNQPPNSSYWQLLAQKGADGQGSGDMLKSTYDTDNDGIVDMAEGLNGLTASIEELNYMDGATGNVQEQLDDKLETETDPTVPSWAKQAEKPSYTASEVGAAETEHTHGVSDVTGLQNTLDAKQPLTDNLTAETALADADTVPFYDVSATANRKSTWSNIKSVLKTYFDTLYNNYNLPTASDSVKGGIKIGANLTMDGDTLNATGGGGGGIAPSNVANIVAKTGNGSGLVKLTWQDPNDTYVDGNLLCTWQGTKVVYKTDSYPANETDGTLAIDSTTRNAYENDELSITGLTNDTPYYIALFPYSDQGVVNKNIANRITATPQAYALYGYKRTKADSNPATRLVATDMAVGMGKATMNTSTGAIDLASWTNAWFVEGNKPVMMRYDGTIDYELDPNDYTKKADGTTSDIANSSYAGNAMALFPTCWVKRWEDSTYEYFQVCDTQLDSDFKAYAHQREDGSIMEWFARSIYDGANVSSKIRSISGLAPCNEVAGNTQLAYAQANGTLWECDTWSRVALIWDLLRLMSLNDNVQQAWGYGYYTGMSAASSLKNSGTGNTKGQFYGKLENDVVKVFHVENFWGNIYKLMQGLLYNTSGKYGVKMCRPYSTTGSGYTATSYGLSGTSGGYQSAHNMSEYGLLPTTVSGSDSTYIPDGVWWNTSQQNLARFGCAGNDGLHVGCALNLGYALSGSYWVYGLALTCEQPLAA